MFCICVCWYSDSRQKFHSVTFEFAAGKVSLLPSKRARSESTLALSLSSQLCECESVQKCNSTGERYSCGKLQRKGTGQVGIFLILFWVLWVIWVCVCVCLFVGDLARRVQSFCFRDYMQTILSVNFSLTYPYLCTFCVDALLFFFSEKSQINLIFQFVCLGFSSLLYVTLVKLVRDNKISGICWAVFMLFSAPSSRLRTFVISP